MGEGEVLQIATIAELRAGESGFLTSQSLPRLGEKASLLKESLKQKLPARLHRNFEKLEEGSSDALHQARVRPGLCVGCATCMTFDKPLTPVLPADPHRLLPPCSPLYSPTPNPPHRLLPCSPLPPLLPPTPNPTHALLTASALTPFSLGRPSRPSYAVGRSSRAPPPSWSSSVPDGPPQRPWPSRAGLGRC